MPACLGRSLPSIRVPSESWSLMRVGRGLPETGRGPMHVTRFCAGGTGSALQDSQACMKLAETTPTSMTVSPKGSCRATLVKMPRVAKGSR